jgi:hypothetical protein
MDYAGAFPFFDFKAIETYPLSERPNLVSLSNFVDTSSLEKTAPSDLTPDLSTAADLMADYVSKGLPVVVFFGAHIIKNGLSPILIRWIEQGWITHLATNGAGCIHDFELGLIGETSEDVPDALPRGKFGQAEETGHFINQAANQAQSLNLGFGEAMGRLLCGELDGLQADCQYPDKSVMATAWKARIPFTIHVCLGQDIVHQHPEFDGGATGAASGRDFGVFTASIQAFTRGGLFVNIGSAVAGPEVLLKAVSMISNVGTVPSRLDTIVFDIREILASDNARDTSKASYYYRDFKSIIVRIPSAYHGKGHYVCGNMLNTLPLFHSALSHRLCHDA